MIIALGDNEFVTSYTLDLGPYGGDADATAETARAYDGDAGTPSNVSDFALLGRPYIYKGQVNPLNTSQNYVDAALNRATVTRSHFYEPTNQLTSRDKCNYYSTSYYITNGTRKEFNSTNSLSLIHI